jgi:hypothetical protein
MNTVRQFHSRQIASPNLAKAEQTALEISVSAIIPDSSRFFPRRGIEMQASGTSLAIITLSVSVRDAWA